MGLETPSICEKCTQHLRAGQQRTCCIFEKIARHLRGFPLRALRACFAKDLHYEPPPHSGKSSLLLPHCIEIAAPRRR